MPSEVFAEDLERLLEQLEGVAAARIVATDAGEIDRIYVTASGESDEAKVRQMVAAALMSRYSLAVDAWRIRVARLREARPASPRWSLHRVEEVLTATQTRVTVELRSEDSGRAPRIGTARGPTDAAGRLRTAAQAVLDALKPSFEEDERRALVEAILPVTLATGRAVLVAVSVTGASTAERYVGAALVEGSEAEAVIAATLDAVGKRGAPHRGRGWMMRDRREELESMEAHYRRLREPQRLMPRPARAPHERGPDDLGAEPPTGGPEPPDRPEAPSVEGFVSETFTAEERPAGRPSLPPAPDTGRGEEGVTTLEQIRPERQGGVEVAQPMNRVTPSPRSSMEDDFLRHLVATATPVHIRCRDGYEILGGVVREFGTYSLQVETDAGRELVFKHGIISIRPMSARSVG
ncbi:MAG: RNA chaperone Hfq [Armatimonadota bacterium]|nr:RNA chaperone Hfq [Armatimonadota bacterium]MDR7451187.1 RNA chaperone Hfq [Armatimonadota bacterium]MDR7467208.1 RNA chaperone Hfq [Armatimonadota bacterium]MDR7494864.1 RNA chaperone Hfq [Armatimonadota bacterium]MDR7500068.1 RNA chaperone Hfq [Armatimonadota bacterium]